MANPNIPVTDKRDHDANPLDPEFHGAEAVAALQAKVAENPLDEESWFALGLEYFEDKWNEAVKCFSRCVAIDPFNPEHYFRRGRKYVSMDEWEKALADFTMATHLESEIAPFWHYRGVANFFLGCFDEAIECFMRSVALNVKYDGDMTAPSVDWAWMAYQKAGKKEEALKILDLMGDGSKIADSDIVYKQRVLLYQSKTDPDAFNAAIDRSDDLDAMTVIYGLANYYYYIEGNVARNVELLDEVLVYPTWHQCFAWKLAKLECEAHRAELKGE